MMSKIELFHGVAIQMCHILFIASFVELIYEPIPF